MASPVLTLPPLLSFPEVLTAAGIAGLGSSAHQIQSSCPGIKTVLRTRADTPFSCTTYNPTWSSILTLQVGKRLQASIPHLASGDVSWPPWGREEEVSSADQEVVPDDQGKGWAQERVRVRGQGWKGPGNSMGRTAVWIITVGSPKPVKNVVEEDPEPLSGSHRGCTIPLRPGLLRVSFKTVTGARPNGVQSSLWVLSVPVRGVSEQGIHLPRLVTWGTIPGWSCQNQDKTEKPVKLWWWPSSSWEQVHPHPSVPGFQGPEHAPHRLTQRESMPYLPPRLPPSLPLLPLGSSPTDCPDSLLQCHKDQHFKPMLQGFLPLPSFLQGPTEGCGEKREWGVCPRLCYLTGGPALCQDLDQDLDSPHGWPRMLGQGGEWGGAQEAGREMKGDEDRKGVKVRGERWQRHSGLEAREREKTKGRERSSPVLGVREEERRKGKRRPFCSSSPAPEWLRHSR